MKRLDIDFAPKTLRHALARTHPAAWLAAAATLAFCVWTTITAMDLMRRQHDLGVDLRRMQAILAKQVGKRHAPPPVAIPQAESAAVNTAIAQLNLPWRDLFDAVESATPPGIALVALEPDADKRIVKVTAEARTVEAMIAYVEDLKRQPFFGSVSLTGHEVNARDPNRPFRFQFDAQWRNAP